MGPYCKFCDFRCFVIRVLADGATRMMATCLRGMEFDRQACGQDHTTAINPVTDPEAVEALRARLGATATVPSAAAEAQAMSDLREQIITAEKAAQAAADRAPRPFGKGNDGAKHLQNALGELRLARVYADAYVDVARQEAGLPR